MSKSKIKRIQVDVSGKGYKSQQDRLYQGGGDMCALSSSRTENKINIIVDMKAVYENSTRGNPIKNGNKTPALDHNCNIGLIGKQIRRLTEIECERLQGFPDNWTDNVSSTQRYKCLGNAVSVPVVKAVMEKLFRKDTP